MEQIASALGDGARWRIVELLTERPRSVGELAELTGLRQPQTTKHLQTLARAGLVTVFPLGQRRVYAIESAPLQALERRLRQLVAATEAHAGERDALARYRTAIDAESASAHRDRWADGRGFSFERALPVPRELVWRHWVEPELLTSWWAPPSMTVTDCVLEPEPGGRAVLDYRDAEGRRYRSAGRVRTAQDPGHLVFDLSVLDGTGAVSFTGHYDLTLETVPEGTRLRLDLTITETTVAAVPYIAGIETGWGQVLDHLAAAVGSSAHTTGQPTPKDKDTQS
ncbi:metalloregulator ArsR/SmtB family transcription factor [Nocardia sp. NBC_00416]|uniref:metalloregulator ArsR/SmtB family transcription factor n=1 Tax=Nocardia sp. NBC_00416 TaxID=2975991 RepID=UPI002E21EB96